VGLGEPVSRAERKDERPRVDVVTKNFPKLIERAAIVRMPTRAIHAARRPMASDG
jgi:hypothetical protein